MAKMEAILKKWYDALRDDNKIFGMRCKDCGAVEFPPVPVCNTCGKFDMEWYEMDGEGELVSLSYSPMGVHPYSQKPSVTGYVKLKEGPYFEAILLGVNEKKQWALFDRMKNGEVIKTRLEVSKMNDEISFPCLRLEEDIEK